MAFDNSFSADIQILNIHEYLLVLTFDQKKGFQIWIGNDYKFWLIDYRKTNCATKSSKKRETTKIEKKKYL